MPVLLFVLWLMFNERITIDVLIVGIIIVVLLCVAMKMVGLWNPSKDIQALSRIPSAIGFVLRLVYEVFKANIHMIMLVLSPNPNERIRPKILRHYTNIKSDGGLVALANSITLTTGTEN